MGQVIGRVRERERRAENKRRRENFMRQVDERFPANEPMSAWQIAAGGLVIFLCILIGTTLL